jgi:hypothetical protein
LAHGLHESFPSWALFALSLAPGLAERATIALAATPSTVPLARVVSTSTTEAVAVAEYRCLGAIGVSHRSSLDLVARMAIIRP